MNVRELWIIISLKTFKMFSHTYRKTTDCMALKVFHKTILLLKVDRFEGILNQIKIDRMVNDHSSSCNL